jgi:hypothetical protein
MEIASKLVQIVKYCHSIFPAHGEFPLKGCNRGNERSFRYKWGYVTNTIPQKTTLDMRAFLRRYLMAPNQHHYAVLDPTTSKLTTCRINEFHPLLLPTILHPHYSPLPSKHLDRAQCHALSGRPCVFLTKRIGWPRMTRRSNVMSQLWAHGTTSVPYRPITLSHSHLHTKSRQTVTAIRHAIRRAAPFVVTSCGLVLTLTAPAGPLTLPRSRPKDYAETARSNLLLQSWDPPGTYSRASADPTTVKLRNNPSYPLGPNGHLSWSL